jgi:hypothetical protein
LATSPLPSDKCMKEAAYPAERINTMLKPIVTQVGTIKTIEDRKDLILVTDPLEVNWILDYLGYPAASKNDPMEFSGLFVAVQDGDYEEVFAFEGCVPYTYKDLWKINVQLTRHYTFTKSVNYIIDQFF